MPIRTKFCAQWTWLWRHPRLDPKGMCHVEPQSTEVETAIRHDNTQGPRQAKGLPPT